MNPKHLFVVTNLALRAPILFLKSQKCKSLRAVQLGSLLICALGCLKKSNTSEQKATSYDQLLFPDASEFLRVEVKDATSAICIDATHNFAPLIDLLKTSTYKMSLTDADHLAKNRVKCTPEHSVKPTGDAVDKDLPRNGFAQNSIKKAGLLTVSWQLSNQKWQFTFVDQNFKIIEKQLGESEGKTLIQVLADPNNDCEAGPSSCPVDLVPRERLRYKQIQEAKVMQFDDYDGLTQKLVEMAEQKPTSITSGSLQNQKIDVSLLQPNVGFIIPNDLTILFHNLKVTEQQQDMLIAQLYGKLFSAHGGGLAQGLRVINDFKLAVSKGEGVQKTELMKILLTFTPLINRISLKFNELANDPKYKGKNNAIAVLFPELTNDERNYFRFVQIVTLLEYVRTKTIAEANK
jgi:hypothetical protein